MDIFEELFKVLENRKTASPDTSYTASLFSHGAERINEKIMEEAAETCEAGLENDKSHLIYEICDLLYHTFVLAAYKGVSVNDIKAELVRRFGTSGIAEKAARKAGNQT